MKTLPLFWLNRSRVREGLSFLRKVIWKRHINFAKIIMFFLWPMKFKPVLEEQENVCL
jgi:hypothetical protein